MRPQTYTARRGTASSWSPNRNTVRHTPKRSLGSISSGVIMGVLVLIVSLIYVTQGTQATNYDYELATMNDEIAELEAKKEDLAVEKARLTSIAASETSEVAANMADAAANGYAN